MVELLITLTIIIIFTVVASPNLTSFIHKTQARTRADSLFRLIHFARSEAIKRNIKVSLCAGAVHEIDSNVAQWHDGVRIVVGSCDSAKSQVIRITNDFSLNGNLQYRGFPDSSSLQFLPSGMSLGNGTFYYYNKHAKKQLQWKLIINHAGRARIIK